MRFVLVECVRGEFPGWRQWRATAVTDEKTVDMFFFQPNLALARAYVESKYPGSEILDGQS